MYLPRLTRVLRYPSHRVRNIIRSCLVRKPHQAPHQLAKRPITHGFILVVLFTSFTLIESGFYLPERTSNLEIKPRRFFSAKSCCEIVTLPACQSLEKRQPTYHRNLPRLLIGTILFRSSTKLNAPSLESYSKPIIHIHEVLLLWRQSPTRPAARHTQQRACALIQDSS